MKKIRNITLLLSLCALLLAEDAQCEVSNIDLLTYAGREGNLEDVIAAHANRYHFIKEVMKNFFCPAKSHIRNEKRNFQL